MEVAEWISVTLERAILSGTILKIRTSHIDSRVGALLRLQELLYIKVSVSGSFLSVVRTSRSQKPIAWKSSARLHLLSTPSEWSELLFHICSPTRRIVTKLRNGQRNSTRTPRDMRVAPSSTSLESRILTQTTSTNMSNLLLRTL